MSMTGRALAGWTGLWLRAWAGAWLIAATAGAQDAKTAAERLGLSMSSGQPIEIRADELEALPDESGRDRVIFQRNVRVSQADMVLHCSWL